MARGRISVVRRIGASPSGGGVLRDRRGNFGRGRLTGRGVVGEAGWRVMISGGTVSLYTEQGK